MQPSITTHSGRAVNLLDPQPEQIDIGDIAHSLSLLCRFTGHTSRFFSVAEHSVLVANAVPPALRLQALLHDAHEAYLGDWSTPLKRSLSTQTMNELRSIENRLIDCIGLALGVALGPHPIIKQADRLALSVEARCLMNGVVDGAEIDQAVGHVRAWSPRVSQERFLSQFHLLRTADKQFSGADTNNAPTIAGIHSRTETRALSLNSKFFVKPA